MPDVIVVGAGITGASVAYHVTRLGASVILIDKALPGCGVTGSSFAWIGASGVSPGPASALRRAATEDYRRLEAELPDVGVAWTGSLSWSSACSLTADLDEDQRLLDGTAIATLEPNLRHPPPWAVHTPGDGAVDPVAVTEALVEGARQNGAEVLVGTSVASLVMAAGRVVGVRSSGGELLKAPATVIAAGAEAPQLCEILGVDTRIRASPALLIRLAAVPGLVNGVIAAPQMDVRQESNGTLLAALGYGGETSHDQLMRRVQCAVADISSTFRHRDGIRLTTAHVAWRPVPIDGEPVIGPVPGVDGLYLAVMHSAVTLAPVVGRLIAEEMVRGVDATELRGCRLARFGPATT